jgi:protein involved in polysaccharide export with SLBB domain
LSALNNFTLAVVFAFAVTLMSLFAIAERGMAAINPPSAPSAYVLHVNDQLSVVVMGHDDYTKQVTILPDGTFDYPLVGTVRAAGMTVPELTSYLKKGLSGELNQPDVVVTVTQTLTQVVSVLGAVNKAGSYPYQQDWRVVDALAAAGGLAVSPDMTSITVVRTGSLTPFSINANKLMAGQDASQNIALQPGDTVLVQQKDSSATTIQVSGEVKIPGSYPLGEKGETPLAAIIAAGGATKNAALSQSQVLHDGVVRSVDLRYVISDLSEAPNSVVLYPGDSLLIPTISRKVSVLGAVNDPETYNIPDGESLTVSQAVGLANGTIQGANLTQVNILREVGGKPSMLAVNLDKIYSGSSAADDIAVKPGDVIFVPSKVPKAYRPQDLVLLVPFLQLLHL